MKSCLETLSFQPEMIYLFCKGAGEKRPLFFAYSLVAYGSTIGIDSR